MRIDKRVAVVGGAAAIIAGGAGIATAADGSDATEGRDRDRLGDLR